MKPQDLKTKIFLDSGDPKETREIISLLGFLDGQTTNPTLISKNPEAAARLEKGEKFTSEEILDFYKEVVEEISSLIPKGSVSVEVYADSNTTAEEMEEQGKNMFSWIDNAHIKLPITEAGLKVAQSFISEGIRVNMTLCFSQEQAAGVYAATKGASKGDVFVSPFIGRLDDRGENGISFIQNTLDMYGNGDGHVEVLTASVRSYEHFLAALAINSDIITAPAKTLREWAEKGMTVPDADYEYDKGELKDFILEDLDLNMEWNKFDLKHELTDKGIERFASDWNSLIQ